jgi:hypothetical protein
MSDEELKVELNKAQRSSMFVTRAKNTGFMAAVAATDRSHVFVW